MIVALVSSARCFRRLFFSFFWLFVLNTYQVRVARPWIGLNLTWKVCRSKTNSTIFEENNGEIFFFFFFVYEKFFDDYGWGREKKSASFYIFEEVFAGSSLPHNNLIKRTTCFTFYITIQKNISSPSLATYA